MFWAYFKQEMIQAFEVLRPVKKDIWEASKASAVVRITQPE